MKYEDAEREYGPMIRRAFTYKALNRLIQGSAADQTKKAMVDCYEEGLVPLITVHDELGCSVERDVQAQKIKKIINEKVKLVIFIGENKDYIKKQLDIRTNMIDVDTLTEAVVTSNNYASNNDSILFSPISLLAPYTLAGLGVSSSLYGVFLAPSKTKSVEI